MEDTDANAENELATISLEENGSKDGGGVEEHDVNLLEEEDSPLRSAATLRGEASLEDRLASLSKTLMILQKAEEEMEDKSVFQQWYDYSFSPSRPDPYTPNPVFLHSIYDNTRLFWQTVTVITAILCFIQTNWESWGLVIWYATLIIYLFGNKIYFFYTKGWLLYFIDLCYYSMMHALVKAIWRDDVSTRSGHIFCLINGPVLGSSLVLGQRPGFYDQEVFAGFFLHTLQGWFSFYARQVECIEDGEEVDEVSLFTETFVYYYLPWAGAYYLVILVKPFIPGLKNYATLYDDTVNPGKPLGSDEWKISFLKKSGYMCGHAFASFCGAVAASFAFNNRYVHITYLTTVFMSCLNNEAAFYETSIWNVKRSGMGGVYFLGVGIVLMVIVGFITKDYDERLPMCV